MEGLTVGLTDGTSAAAQLAQHSPRGVTPGTPKAARSESHVGVDAVHAGIMQPGGAA